MYRTSPHPKHNRCIGQTHRNKKAHNKNNNKNNKQKLFTKKKPTEILFPLSLPSSSPNLGDSISWSALKKESSKDVPWRAFTQRH
jgi:hypothetical protein